MAWWQVVNRDGARRLAPRLATRSRMPDVLPSLLWSRRTVTLGERLHFCVAHSEQGPHRTIEWKGYDWLIGYRVYRGSHQEREPSRYGDPDSYE